MSAPRSKLSFVREAMAAGDWQKAISLAAKFPDLGDHRAAILDAHSAYTNERFMRQIGRNVDVAKTLGRCALIDRFGLD